MAGRAKRSMTITDRVAWAKRNEMDSPFVLIDLMREGKFRSLDLAESIEGRYAAERILGLTREDFKTSPTT
jgi:hypothetical protein